MRLPLAGAAILLEECQPHSCAADAARRAVPQQAAFWILPFYAACFLLEWLRRPHGVPQPSEPQPRCMRTGADGGPSPSIAGRPFCAPPPRKTHTHTPTCRRRRGALAAAGTRAPKHAHGAPGRTSLVFFGICPPAPAPHPQRHAEPGGQLPAADGTTPWSMRLAHGSLGAPAAGPDEDAQPST